MAPYENIALISITKVIEYTSNNLLLLVSLKVLNSIRDITILAWVSSFEYSVNCNMENVTLAKSVGWLPSCMQISLSQVLHEKFKF